MMKRKIILIIAVVAICLSSCPICIYAGETYTVSGKVVIMENTDGTSPNAYGLKDVNIVIDGNTVATTDIDGKFNAKLSSGTYTATLDYAYGYDRTISIIVYNANVNYKTPIPLVAVDYVKDNKINIKDVKMFDSGKTSYDVIYDLNKDGVCNTDDENIFLPFYRMASLSKITYSDVSIIGEKITTTTTTTTKATVETTTQATTIVSYNTALTTKKQSTTAISTTAPPKGYNGPTKTAYSNYRIVATNGAVKIALTADSKIDGYYVYSSKTANGNYKKIADIKSSKDCCTVIKNLESKTVYYFALIGYVNYDGKKVEVKQSDIKIVYVK